MDSCILYQNADQTVTLLDIPRSIELAEGFYNQTGNMRLVSTTAIKEPYPLAGLDRREKGKDDTSSHTLDELLLWRHIQLAWDSVNETFSGPWCLSRITETSTHSDTIVPNADLPDSSLDCNPLRCARAEALQSALEEGSDTIYHNWERSTQEVHIQVAPSAISAGQGNDVADFKEAQIDSRPLIFYLPPFSSGIHGSIEEKRDLFSSSAPRFDLVIMDPPWPNRSARRKNDYQTRYGTRDAALLLGLIPLNEHLAEDALVGVWVTNKPAIHEIILGPDGFFQQWDLSLVEVWIWLKVTVSGEPIFPLDSFYRKPYETLLLGQKKSRYGENSEVKRRILMGVPDLHSRKPNLKALFEHKLPEKYEALEVFARNITAGWWAWGSEVLKFQFEDCWVKN